MHITDFPHYTAGEWFIAWIALVDSIALTIRLRREWVWFRRDRTRGAARAEIFKE